MELLKARKGFLTILKGRPATGKTTAALLDMMNRVYLKDKIMFIEYGFAQSVLYSKLVNYFDFDLKELDNVNIVDGLDYSISMIEELVRRQKPTFVYIDYIGLIPDNKDEKTRESFLKETYNRLSVLAAIQKISIIVVAQQSRDYEKENKIEIAFSGSQGFGEITKDSVVDNIIPMFVERDSDIGSKRRNIFVFSKDGVYEKYSEFDVGKVYTEDF